MEEDKRSVSTDALETLGKIIGEHEKRDAIHLAVEPVLAKEILYPGEDVGVDGTKNNLVGIVDPFLKCPVYPGQRFWLVLYPRTITSLRHVWEHPDFDKDLAHEKTEEEKQLINEEKIRNSKKWIRDYVEDLNNYYEKGPYYEEDAPTSYKEIMKAAKEYIEQGHGFHKGPLFEDQRTHPLFWHHYEVITGQTLKRANNFFRCSC